MNEKVANLYIVYSIFLVSDQEKANVKEKKKPPTDYPDLSESDDGFSKGGEEEEYSTTETEESEEKPPHKTTKHTPSMKQTTLTQLYREPRTPVATPVAAAENGQEGEFMPPFFIAPYKTDAVNNNIGIVILLPAGVATRNINDISVWMEPDPTILCVRIKIPDFMTRLMFFPSLLKYKKHGKQVYPISQMTRFKDGLDEFIFNLRATVHDDVFFIAHIPVEKFNVVPDLEDSDWQVIRGGAERDIPLLIVTMKTPTVAASYFGMQDNPDADFKGFLDEE